MSVRSTFALYRLGQPDTSLISGALEIYAPSIGPLQIYRAGDILSGLAGQIDFVREALVSVGDLLCDQTTGRWFSVAQISDQPAIRRALVAEFLLPMPDEFESGVIDGYWTALHSLAVDVELGELYVQSGSDLSKTTPLNIPFLYQLITGDFDIYARLRCTVGGGGNYGYALLKAGDTGDTKAVTVGVRMEGGSGQFVRQDYVSSIQEVSGNGLSQNAWGLVRLRRVGARIAAYYAPSPSTPEIEEEWIELQAGAGNAWTSTAQLRVGLAGYLSTGTTAGHRYSWLRNWLAS
ncbi:MAG: hypothetical protein ACRDGM_04285 [bacterium]